MGPFQFCLSCGASSDAEELGPAPATNDSQPRHHWLHWLAHWRTPVVVGPLLAALVLAGGVGAQMLTAEIPDPVREPPVTCWDGRAAPPGGTCRAVSGVTGLHWVFPTFHSYQDRCIDVLEEHPEYPRPAMFDCEFAFGEHMTRATYLEVDNVESGLRFFFRTLSDAEREKEVTTDGTPFRFIWRDRTADGYRLTAMYVDFPFAVTILADRPALRERAFDLLDFRAPQELQAAFDQK